jgi:uncharacterized caspase-like protein
MRFVLSKSRLLLFGLLAATLHAQAGKRIALIIGNDAYNVSPLRNAVNDARLVEQGLKGSGFQTMLVENARKQDMDRVVGEFLDKIGPDDTALFFYAGHGVQIENENFLVPVDFTPGATISAAKFACLSVAQVFDELKRRRAKKNIVILDACRTNPVQSKYSLEGGLAKPQDAPKETFIAFSTSPGQTAADNPNGRNSWFTEALADYMSQPELTIELNEVLTRVKKRVADATEGRQTPWTTSNLTSGFYFHEPAGGASSDTTMLEKWLSDALVREQREEWADAAGLIERILEKKPGGRIEEAARRKLPYLVSRRDGQARYDAADFAASAALGKQALQADPFAVSAALHAVNGYLLADRIPEAVEMLKAVRARGDSASVDTANRMLKELAAAAPQAAKELETAAPPPPPIEELFAESRFGVPDMEAGKRYLAANPLDLTRWTKDLKMEVVMPAPLVVALSSAAPGTADPNAPATVKPIDIFHIEVVPTTETRNLRIRRPASAGPETDADFGYVDFNGPSSPIVYEGTQVVLPTKLKVPAGRYEIRAVDDGKVLNRQEIEVKPLSTQSYQVKRP